MAMFILAQVQKQGGKALFIDAEFAFSKDYAQKIGVDTDKLMVSQPSTAEEALDIIDKISKTGEVDIIVLDSVASLVPEKEFEGEISDGGIAIQARIMSKGLRMLAGNIAKTKTSVIFINQVRDKVGVFFGNKTTTPGGKALKFFSSVRLEVRKGKQIKETRNGKEEVVGNWLGIVAVKNKVGIPWRKAELELIFEKGIDITGDYLDSCVEEKIISKTGNSHNFGDVALGGSRDKAKKFLTEDKKIFDKIKKALLDKDAK